MSDSSVRKIIHLDMDAFYASVEIKDNPDLKESPVVVGGSPNSRGVVSAANYKAREFGIHSAMPCSRAQRLCPQAVFVPPRFARYQEVSGQIQTIFRKYTDLVEPLSLDEAWLDVTENHIGSPSATWVAERIKKDIFSETGLTSSAGVSYNKFLAKIASDEKKPDGLFVITPGNASEFLAKLAVKKLPGVGKVTHSKLQLLGIEKGYQLLEKSEQYLVEHFGKFGRYLYQIIRGVDNRPVITHRERKSIGIENTFREDYQYGESLKKELDRLIKGLFKRLQKKKQRGRTFSLKVKFFDFQQITRSVTLNHRELSDDAISQLAHKKLKEVALREFPNKRIRLLGLSMSNFEKDTEAATGNEQLDIFYFLSNNTKTTVD
ncbi:MAG: DNA polymerase IV [Proteobacteria bacterium]|nr:DNA polymerase IV [Pseudomonadota bacterium]